MKKLNKGETILIDMSLIPKDMTIEEFLKIYKETGILLVDKFPKNCENYLLGLDNEIKE